MLLPQCGQPARQDRERASRGAALEEVTMLEECLSAATPQNPRGQRLWGGPRKVMGSLLCRPCAKRRQRMTTKAKCSSCEEVTTYEGTNKRLPQQSRQ